MRAVTFVTLSSYLFKNSSKQKWIKSELDKIGSEQNLGITVPKICVFYYLLFTPIHTICEKLGLI